MSGLLIGLFGMVLCFSLINLMLCAVDKRAAQKGRRRIAEKRFFLFAALGGGPGLWLGMRWFHHKTKHPLFWFAAVGSTLLYGGLFLFLLLRFGGLL